MTLNDSIINQFAFFSKYKFIYKGKIVGESLKFPYTNILGKEYLPASADKYRNYTGLFYFPTTGLYNFPTSEGQHKYSKYPGSLINNRKLIAKLTSRKKDSNNNQIYLFKGNSKEITGKVEGNVFNKKRVFYLKNKDSPCMEYYIHPQTQTINFDNKQISLEEALFLQGLIIEDQRMQAAIVYNIIVEVCIFVPVILILLILQLPSEIIKKIHKLFK
jgi:hypothetical protein